MKDNHFISVVIPVYGKELNLKELYNRLKNSLVKITNNFEIIMVNDASPDNAWKVITELSNQDNRVRGINLSRNFGQHYAISAGLDYIRGNWCIVMDCDLQDQPEEIIKLFTKAQEGYDIVVGRRFQRKDNFIIKLTSKLFYVLFNYLTEQSLNNNVANFGIYSRKVIDAVKKFKEKDRSFGLLILLTGFSRVEIDINHSFRSVGESGYNFQKRLNMAIDLILSHSNKPLKLAVQLGFSISFFSFIYALWLIIQYIYKTQLVSGWTSIMVSLFFLSGLLMVVIGMVGLYIGKIYDEIKGRPLYIIDTTTFDKSNIEVENLCQKK